MSSVSGDFPVQLATRLPDWSAGGLLRCVVLPVCPCVVSLSKFHETDTHDLLRRMSRGCYGETSPVEFQLQRSPSQSLARHASATEAPPSADLGDTRSAQEAADPRNRSFSHCDWVALRRSPGRADEVVRFHYISLPGVAHTVRACVRAIYCQLSTPMI